MGKEAESEVRLREAYAHYRAGRLGEATRSCGLVLVEHPRSAASLELLGLIALRERRYELAVEWLRRAIESEPGKASLHCNLGGVYQQQGRLAEAEKELATALKLDPGRAEILANLGLTLSSEGELDRAIACYREAIEARPDLAELHFQLGNALQGKNCLPEAVACYERALERKPSSARARCNLGSALLRQGKTEKALKEIARALELDPQLAEAENAYGVALKEQGRIAEAAEHFVRAVQRRPDYAEALNNLGCVWERQGRAAASIEAHRRALALRPEFAEAHNGLGNALGAQGEPEAARKEFEQAIALKPDLAEAHCNLALVELRAGEFEEGWREYEWRWRMNSPAVRRREFHQPQWRGASLEGARILLHAEQGLGDTIQFLRYAPLVARAGGRTILEISPRLRRLAEGLGAEATIAAGESLPEFDWHCPLMSLPLAFGTKLETIPREIPYLRAPEAARQKAAGLDCWTGAGVRVGVAWAGRENFVREDARQRSIERVLLEPLLATEGARFYSLQMGEAAEGSMMDLSASVEDLADTAAQIERMDLVITVDTAVAHLAGALGKPVWVLLPFASDWRWLSAGEASPWYPTMQLFRQRRAGAWRESIEAARQELEGLVAERG